jgi:hypothetical protein
MLLKDLCSGIGRTKNKIRIFQQLKLKKKKKLKNRRQQSKKHHNNINQSLILEMLKIISKSQPTQHLNKSKPRKFQFHPWNKKNNRKIQNLDLISVSETGKKTQSKLEASMCQPPIKLSQHSKSLL